MKLTNKLVWFGAMMVFATLCVFAQTNPPVVPPLPSLPTEVVPTGVAWYWTMAIACITPLLVTGIWKLVPKIPVVLLPTMTPFIGLALGAGLNALANANLGWVDMAQAGGLAVLIREIVNKAITLRLSPKPEPVPPTT